MDPGITVGPINYESTVKQSTKIRRRRVLDKSVFKSILESDADSGSISYLPEQGNLVIRAIWLLIRKLNSLH